MNILYKKLISVGIICLLIGLMIGFYAGSYVTIKAVASIGVGFLDPVLIEKAINQYESNIKSCYPMNLSTWKKNQ